MLAKSNKVYKLPGGKQGDFDIITDIQQARLAMYNTIIHGDITETADDPGNCQWLLECFENYKYEFNNKLQEWTNKPLHDKHSHLMDAFRYLVQATKELDFFGGQFFEQGGTPTQSVDYIQDYTGVWA